MGQRLLLGLLTMVAITSSMGHRNPQGQVGNRDVENIQEGYMIPKEPLIKRSGKEVKVKDEIAEVQQRQILPILPQRCEVCCDGVKLNGEFDYDVQCCGRRPYYLLSSRCCPTPTGPVVVNYPTNATLVNFYQLQCCGNALYNITTQMCCGTTIRNRSPSRGCCGNTLINPSTTICCNGHAQSLNNRTLHCCGNTAFDPTRALCLPNNSTRVIPAGIRQPQLCGNVIIDFTTQICCNGVVYNRSNTFTICCNNRTFDSRTDICCNGTVNRYQPFSRCCGTRLYQPSSQVCCSGTPYNIPEGDGQLCLSVASSFPAPPSGRCCGTHLLHTLNYNLCCNNANIYTFVNETEFYEHSCCGSTSYNTRNQICCIDRVYRREGINDKCCGNRLYNRAQQTCCGGSLYANGFVPRNKCCCTDQTCGVQPIPGLLA